MFGHNSALNLAPLIVGKQRRRLGDLLARTKVIQLGGVR